VECGALIHQFKIVHLRGLFVCQAEAANAVGKVTTEVTTGHEEHKEKKRGKLEKRGTDIQARA
jgi:hypothetical protein